VTPDEEQRLARRLVRAVVDLVAAALGHLLSTLEMADERGAAGVLTDSTYAWFLYVLRLRPPHADPGAVGRPGQVRDRGRGALANTARRVLDVHAARETPHE
jgi:hypothetical protein